MCNFDVNFSGCLWILNEKWFFNCYGWHSPIHVPCLNFWGKGGESGEIMPSGCSIDIILWALSLTKEMVRLAAPKGLFPPEPEHYRGPKLKVAIIGAGLAGMSTAVELLDQGHEVFLLLCLFLCLNGLLCSYHNILKFDVVLHIGKLPFEANWIDSFEKFSFVIMVLNVSGYWANLLYFILFFSEILPFRWIYMSRGLLLVAKLVLLLINVEITLKWDCTFSLVATAIFSDWWKRYTSFTCSLIVCSSVFKSCMLPPYFVALTHVLLTIMLYPFLSCPSVIRLVFLSMLGLGGCR